MRLRRIARLVLLVAAGAAAPTASFARYEGNLNFFIGQKWLNDSDWQPVEEQPELGVMLAFAQERAPIHFALDVLASRKSATVASLLYGPVEVKARTIEYSVGVRKVWNAGATHPFLAAGGCLVVSRLEFDSATFSPSYGDQDYGVWIEGGVTWRIGGHFNLGIDTRYSRAYARYYTDAGPVDVAVGGFHAGLLIGYGW